MYSTPTPITDTPVLLLALRESVRAGFRSPAEDLGAQRIDVLEHLIVHPAATYALTVRGESMREYGIFDFDTLLVDRAIRPKHGHTVVANLDNEFVCKFLWKRNGILKLKAGNPTFPDITPKEGQILEVWGVVLTSIKRFTI